MSLGEFWGLLHLIVVFLPFSGVHLLFLLHLCSYRQSLASEASSPSPLQLHHLLAELISSQQSFACGCLPVLVHWVKRELCSVKHGTATNAASGN